MIVTKFPHFSDGKDTTTVFHEIENKSLKDVTSGEMRLFEVCKKHPDGKEKDACVKGFLEGTSYGMERVSRESN